ncbi:pentapeptide repeat-containing protein [Candidatus Babeliales bacterium]|nr:pentapeptide repeat-containing protein [Candidatus Babeliales bacterium]
MVSFISIVLYSIICASSAYAAPSYDRQNLSGRSYCGQDLSNSTFKRANLTDADFSPYIPWFFGNPQPTKLVGCNFTEARLIRTNLGGADLSKAILDKAVLRRSDCTGSTFVRASLKEADFTRAHCRHTNFGRTIAHKANFSQAMLNGASFYKADLTEAVFSEETSLVGADLRGANLTGAHIPTSLLEQALIDDTTILENLMADNITPDEKITADETVADQLETYEKLVIAEQPLPETTIMLDGPKEVYGHPGTEWNEELYQSTNFRGTTFKAGNGIYGFYGAKFIGSDLSYAIFEDVVLANATFQNANLEGTDFTEVTTGHLYHTDFRYARNLDKALLPPPEALAEAWIAEEYRPTNTSANEEV